MITLLLIAATMADAQMAQDKCYSAEAQSVIARSACKQKEGAYKDAKKTYDLTLGIIGGLTMEEQNQVNKILSGVSGDLQAASFSYDQGLIGLSVGADSKNKGDNAFAQSDWDTAGFEYDNGWIFYGSSVDCFSNSGGRYDNMTAAYTQATLYLNSLVIPPPPPK